MSPKRHTGLRKFNRAIVNPFMKLFAGRIFYTLIFHTGRRSGKAYATPVLAAKTNEFIFIPLPYGADTDWLCNVQATGDCRLQMNAQFYTATTPKVVAPIEALPAFSPLLQRAFNRAGITQFLRLRIQ